MRSQHDVMVISDPHFKRLQGHLRCDELRYQRLSFVFPELRRELELDVDSGLLDPGLALLAMCHPLCAESLCEMMRNGAEENAAGRNAIEALIRYQAVVAENINTFQKRTDRSALLMRTAFADIRPEYVALACQHKLILARESASMLQSSVCYDRMMRQLSDRGLIQL